MSLLSRVLSPPNSYACLRFWRQCLILQLTSQDLTMSPGPPTQGVPSAPCSRVWGSQVRSTPSSFYLCFSDGRPLHRILSTDGRRISYLFVAVTRLKVKEEEYVWADSSRVPSIMAERAVASGSGSHCILSQDTDEDEHPSSAHFLHLMQSWATAARIYSRPFPPA